MSINAEQLRLFVIRPTLKEISLWSQAAENLLMGTAAVESKLGFYLKQVSGPALGIYQIEPATHDDIRKNFPLPEDAELFIHGYSSIELITNLAYATAIARLVYYRVKEPLPADDDIPAMAKYWKQYYNTEKGAGTVDKFIASYKSYVGAS